MSELTIRANGNKNAQVSKQVKEALLDFFSNHGLSNHRDAFLFHHYEGGDFVAISLRSDLSKQNSNAYEFTRGEILMGSDKNKSINGQTIWAHREWIADELF